MAGKNEEQRQKELKKRKQYQSVPDPEKPKGGSGTQNPPMRNLPNQKPTPTFVCYHCGKSGHTSRYCRIKKSESKGAKGQNPDGQGNNTPTTRQGEEWRKAEVERLFRDSLSLPDQEKEEFLSFLQEHHQVFALEKGERGETGLME